MLFGGLGRLFVRFLVWSSGTWVGAPNDRPSEDAPNDAPSNQDNKQPEDGQPEPEGGRDQ